MKLMILGAAGNSGRALARMAIDDGHDVSVAVRDSRKLDPAVSKRAAVHELDLADRHLLTPALAGHDAVINAAGYVGETDGFVALVAGITAATEQALGAGARFWAYGGAALLDIPGTGATMIGLPGVPREYDAHRRNLVTLEASHLDWSIACPGPMIPSPDGAPTPGLRVTSEQWATATPPLLPRLPKIARSLAFKRSVPQITVYYEDVARVILDNLEHEGPLSRRRVAIALPEGHVRTKEAPLARLREARATTEA